MEAVNFPPTWKVSGTHGIWSPLSRKAGIWTWRCQKKFFLTKLLRTLFRWVIAKRETIAIWGRLCNSKDILSIRSANISGFTQKEFFFYREKKTKLARTECGDIVNRSGIMGQHIRESSILRPALSVEGLLKSSSMLAQDEGMLKLGVWRRKRILYKLWLLSILFWLISKDSSVANPLWSKYRNL